MMQLQQEDKIDGMIEGVMIMVIINKMTIMEEEVHAAIDIARGV